MAIQAAYTKKVKVSSDELPASTASLSHGGDLLDSTEMDTNAGYRTRIYGLRDTTISVSCFYDSANAALTALRSAWAARSSVTMSYLPDGTTGFTGSYKVETFDMSGEVGGIETVEITLQGNGALSAV